MVLSQRSQKSPRSHGAIVAGAFSEERVFNTEVKALRGPPDDSNCTCKGSLNWLALKPLQLAAKYSLNFQITDRTWSSVKG